MASDDLLPKMEALASAMDDDLEVDEDRRRRTYLAARKIMLRMESTPETLQRIDMAPIQLVVLRALNEKYVMEELVRRGKASVEELASATGFDPALLARLLNFCSVHGMVGEEGVDVYRATRMTKSFPNPGFRGAVTYHHDTVMRAAQMLPKFLDDTGYQNPTDAKDTPFRHASGGFGLFEYLEKTPKVSEAFNEYMSSIKMTHKELTDIYDFDKLWGPDVNNDTVLFVDIGGGFGHRCEALLKAKTNKGRIILQDLPSVVKDVKIDNVEVLEHDFFKEQPVKGAKAYYMRTILHDWADKECILILKNIRDAMADDSVVLLEERVVPDQDAHWISVNMDMAMMLLLAALERSETQWRNLLASAGLKVTSITTFSPEGSAMIEAIKA